jgi:anti-sigma factor RsiW
MSEATLIDYWAGDLADDEMARVEEHFFACGDCAGRLARLAALGPGVATLARHGRIRGVVSRAIVNRLQRDGVHVRMFSLLPGEVVPCSVFPGDDLVVTSLRADFSGVESVTVSVTGPGSSPFSRFEDVPVSSTDAEVLWATPAALVQQLPSIRLEITMTAADSPQTELGRYVLEHSAQP